MKIFLNSVSILFVLRKINVAQDELVESWWE